MDKIVLGSDINDYERAVNDLLNKGWLVKPNCGVNIERNSTSSITGVLLSIVLYKPKHVK